MKLRLRQFDFCLREKEEKGRKITIADTMELPMELPQEEASGDANRT